MIRFASIPRCATRSLQSLGILGEVEGKPHRPITEYPDWRGYQWCAVFREREDWLRSWWGCSYPNPGRKPGDFGMGYEDYDADMRMLHSEAAFAQVPRGGIHGWIPDDFADGYRRYLECGLGMCEYCRDTILDGVPVLWVPLGLLNEFLKDMHYPDVKMNGRAPHEKVLLTV